MSISNNLRKFRAIKGISQQNIADILEIDRRTYINWEKDESDIKSEYIPKIAEIFGIEIKDLFTDSKNKIEIKQENKENRDSSVNNSIVLVMPDKESVDRLVEVLKSNIIK